jgi:hypothetical protein
MSNVADADDWPPLTEEARICPPVLLRADHVID